MVFDLLLAPLARELIYPRRGTRVPVDDAMHELDVGEAMLRGWVVNPGRARVLLYFGGNGENVTYNLPSFSDAFPEHALYLMNYRGYGGSSGDPSEAGISQDLIVCPFNHTR